MNSLGGLARVFFGLDSNTVPRLASISTILRQEEEDKNDGYSHNGKPTSNILLFPPCVT